MNKLELSELLNEMITDIEDNSKKYGCYAYPKTIRSILTGSEFSQIAAHFSDKRYYGIVKTKISVTDISDYLDSMVEDGILRFEMHNGKKRFATIRNLNITSKNKLSEEEISEIDELLGL